MDSIILYLQLQKPLKNFTLTVVEMQQVQHSEKTDSQAEIFCLKRTLYNGRR